MDLTPDEKKMLAPYLLMKTGGRSAWQAGIVLGVAVCAAAVAIVAFDCWPEAGPYTPLAFVVGLVILEQALARRDRRRMARILQKYDAAVQRFMYPEEAEETV